MTLVPSKVLALQATEALQRSVLSHVPWVLFQKRKWRFGQCVDNDHFLHCLIAQDSWLNTYFQ